MLFDFDKINWKNIRWRFIFDKTYRLFQLFQRGLALIILASILIRGIYLGLLTGTFAGFIWWGGVGIFAAILIGIVFLALDGVLYVTDKSTTWLTRKLEKSARIRRWIIFSFVLSLVPLTFTFLYFYWGTFDYFVTIFVCLYLMLLVPAAVISAERAASMVSSQPAINQQTKEITDNLRQLLKKISDENTKNFLEETIICFENGLYRATVVLSWAGAMSLLYNYVIKNHLDEFNVEASRRNLKCSATITDDLTKIRENEFLDILDVLSILGKNAKQELQGCLKLRNACAHPSTLKVSQNRVAAHLETLILNVFTGFGEVQ